MESAERISAPIALKIRSYEKNDRYQHTPYPGLLFGVAAFDLDLDGFTLDL